MWRLVPTLVREMGQAYPELVRAEALITETLKLEETRFRKTLERGLSILDEESRTASSAATGSRARPRSRSTTPTASRSTSRRTRCARAASRVDTDAFNAAMERQREKARASWAGSGEAATEAVWFTLREKLGATEFLGYETETRRGRRGRAGAGRQGGRRAASGRERRGHRQPDAVLRRVRRPGRRHRRDDAPTACASRVTDTQKKAGDLFVHPGTVEEGTLKVGDAARARRRSCPPQRDPAQPFGDASAARGAAPGARRSRGAEGLAGRARPAALRLLASQADDGARRSSGSRTSPTTSCCRIRR